MLFFLPYYIMRYEKHLKEIANNTEKLQSLLQEYTDIRIQLEKVLYGETESVLYADMVKLIIKISDYILKSRLAELPMQNMLLRMKKPERNSIKNLEWLNSKKLSAKDSPKWVLFLNIRMVREA